MSFFSRRKGQVPDDAESLEPVEPVDDDDLGDAGATTATSAQPGPFDESEVDGPRGRIDLGSLWVGGVDGLQLQLEMDQATSQVIAATLVVGESAAQVQAFAAPKSAGLWHDIRGEIAASVVGQGGMAEEGHGPLGTELRTRMPSAGPDGRTVFAPARFLGVDGPRWFLRVVLSGRAAIDEAAAAPLIEVVRSIVVVRGQTPMAPRELLPLALPKDASDATAGDAEADSGDGDARPAHDLNPFERGPEITEVH